MARISLRGTSVNTLGDLPAVGTLAPDFVLVQNDLSELKLSDLVGKPTVLNIFPSIDTGVCATSVRKFNELLSEKGFQVLCISADLPFALARFCGAEGIENVITASAFRSDFGKDYGVKMLDGGLAGLLARSIVVLDAQGKICHTELVPEIAQEPNYDAALAAIASC